MDQLFFSGWDTLLRTFVVGVLAYVVLIVFLRISGKRTLSKMNAFDFIVTVALGSTLANVMLNKEISLAEAALVFGLLVGLQFLVTWSSVRVRWVRQVVTGEPSILLYRGECLPAAMQIARVTEEEVQAAVRASGFAHLSDAEAIVLETDGSLSVVPRSKRGEASSLSGVEAPD